MEPPQTTPSVQSPRIQFRVPPNPLSSGSSVGVGVDGRRLSIADATNEVFIDDDPSEDWTRTTPEKDSWAHRERRRSSMWHKIDSYPSTKPLGSPTPSHERSRRGSILSLFRHGKDKDGRDVLHSGDAEEELSRETTGPAEPEEPAEEPKTVAHERRGSILSLWTWGKDKSGRDVIHSGLDEDD